MGDKAVAASIQAAAVQFSVGMDVADNVAALEALLDRLPAGALAVAPEGALSGYLPEPGFVSAIYIPATEGAIDRMRSLTARQGIHLVVGACVLDGGQWRNRSFYFGPAGEMAWYDKINLASSERGTFTPGDALPVFHIAVDGTPVCLGIQMCREIRYPEQWRALALKGAQVIAYVNNAIGGSEGDSVWRAHMISRAAETQRFVIGANNAATGQICPSMIVSPAGKTLSEVENGVDGAATSVLELSEVSDWVLSQARHDVVEAVRPPLESRP